MIDVEQKKTFIKWVIDSLTLKKRESYWILSYLLNHDVLLTKLMFVNNALATPRGLKISDETVAEVDSGLLLSKDGLEFDDPEQIFHEMRLNWRQTLYLEIDFPNSFHYLPYQTVLETNPYIDETNEEVVEWEKELQGYLSSLEKEAQLTSLLVAINQSIDEEDEVAFRNYTKKYKKIKEL
ncbi:YpiB family protein [Vagococcus sp.]|uniref:YpiB family protein n=1 Tax=Vagococcus sp. TaxID=1933889 RepID=UPI003F9D3226